MHADLRAFASQPIPAARGMKTALIFIVAILGVLMGKVAFANHAASAPAWSAPARSSAEACCFAMMVELDEGYGVTGRETRLVCAKTE